MSETRKRKTKNIPNNSISDKDKTKEGETKTVSPKSNIPLRVLSRAVVIFSLLIIVYFTSNDGAFKIFAKQNEVISGKGQIVECSSAYLREIDKFEGCFPKQCKRFVTDKVITDKEVDELLMIAKKGLKYGGSSGGASILDLHSGALSMGQHFINFYKRSEGKNVFTEKDFTTYKVVKNKIKYSIGHYFGVNPEKIYLTHPTFFSEITSKEAVTVHDEYWHPHVDKETYKSFHYTTLLYLTDYNIDFKGGRFVFIDEKYNRTIEPRKGRVSMFTSGKENLHYVEKVTSGTRYAVTISFTCDKQYAIGDPDKRKFNNDL
ncbi:2-oxoglutarate and iron-dependent oxygenase domain-containing protein 3 isoform X1 [Bombyx mori]|uniref:Fe2OG dioxygenase domain-containing protein n=1 Tax=Bombyx mori TaxID=7091 RepID=A0A8R1WM63_BOMMO|nr:2-oxoglutarate and iron-dependent oxygenase domain-containing protein 3 [Bombyx mori]